MAGGSHPSQSQKGNVHLFQARSGDQRWQQCLRLDIHHQICELTAGQLSACVRECFSPAGMDLMLVSLALQLTLALACLWESKECPLGYGNSLLVSIMQSLCRVSAACWRNWDPLASTTLTSRLSVVGGSCHWVSKMRVTVSVSVLDCRDDVMSVSTEHLQSHAALRLSSDDLRRRLDSELLALLESQAVDRETVQRLIYSDSIIKIPQNRWVTNYSLIGYVCFESVTVYWLVIIAASWRMWRGPSKGKPTPGHLYRRRTKSSHQSRERYGEITTACLLSFN